MSAIKIFLIIKEKSQRVANKNFLLINGVPLHQYFVGSRSSSFDIFIDTDSDEILEFYSGSEWTNVYPYSRKPEHIAMEEGGIVSPAPLMIERFLREFAQDGESVITSHITSPFLTDRSLLKAFEFMDRYDSVSSVEEIKEFAVFGDEDKEKPINFSYDRVVKTQSLTPVKIQKGAFFIINKDVFLQNGLQRVSKSHHYIPLDRIECIDIDNYVDLEIARAVAKTLDRGNEE